jgi:rhodanese-related sulfurtransferase
LALDDVLRRQRGGAVVLDTRDPNEFAVGHLAGSINVGLHGRYAEYVGGVIQPAAPIVLVTEAGMELEAKNRLARIGFDRVAGYLAEPLRVFEEHPDEVTRSSRLGVGDLEARLNTEHDLQLVDVRQPGETALGTIVGAIEIPLTQLNERLASLDAEKSTVVYCAGGYRSSIAASRMTAAGFADVADLLGGYTAWSAAQPTREEQ